jgi:1-acyl-sn-glycerol-3-phosphate acyltransferase
MIKADHTKIGVWFFKYYSNLMIKKDFRSVKIIWNKTDLSEKSIVLIGNHFSWWDGFFANYLNHKLFHKKLHVMMLEEQLSKRMFLSKGGAFSIKRGSRSMVESINYSSELLGNKEHLLVIYPQGVFESLYRYPVTFEPGFVKILEKASGRDFMVLFYAALIDYFEHRRPSLTFYLKKYNFKDRTGAKELERSYNEHLMTSMLNQKES